MKKVFANRQASKSQELNYNPYEIIKDNFTAASYWGSSNFHYSEYGNSETQFSEFSPLPA